MEKYTQSQSHGFFFENEIRCKVFKLEPRFNDTKKLDIQPDENKLNPNEGISIKTTSSNILCCGDILRFYDYDFTIQNTIIILFYKQDNDRNKTIKEIYEVNYNKEFHSLLFGTISKDLLMEYINLIKNIPKEKLSNKIDYIKIKNNLQKVHNMNIQINPKVDSKTQRRVQCSIPNVKELLKNNTKFVISQSNKPICRGIEISSTIESGIRKRITRLERTSVTSIINQSKVTKNILLQQAVKLGIFINKKCKKSHMVELIKNHIKLSLVKPM